MLDLIRLSPRLLFPPGGVDLYRQIALLTEMAADAEVLDVACGKGISLGYFVNEFGAQGSGVDIDPTMTEFAESRSRLEGLGERLQFQTGRSDALPYRDEIFDVTVGEIGLANHCDPADAIRELARVTKPGGFVVLVQLVWKAPVEETRRALLSDHLGVRPLMVVEWRRLMREAGVGEIHVEDWSDEETAFRPTVVKPFPDFAELFSLPERLVILRHAWKRWGWRGVSSAIARENEAHKLLSNERILGLDLLRGRKEPDLVGATALADQTEQASAPPASELPPGSGRKTGKGPRDARAAAAGEGASPTETTGLPLFAGEGPPGRPDTRD